MTSFYIHNVTAVRLQPIQDLPPVDCCTRSIIIETEEGHKLEVSLFGARENLGLIEEYAA